MPIYALGDQVPTIPASAYVHPDAVLIGSVTLGEGVNVWPGAVLRADYGAITVGDFSNIQDGAIIHVTAHGDTILGTRVVVGHNAHIEEAIIEDDCLIASGSVVLNGSYIRKGSIVAAGAVVSPGTQVPERSMVLGIPARVRENFEVPEGHTLLNTELYVANGDRYKAELRRIDG